MTIRLTGIVCTGLRVPEAYPGYYVYNHSWYSQNKVPKDKIIKKEKVLGELIDDEKGANIDFYV